MTQIQKIIAHLNKNEPLTPMSALINFDCPRLASRVYDINEAIADLYGEPHDLQVEIKMTTNGKKYASYRLPKGFKSLPVDLVALAAKRRKAA